MLTHKFYLRMRSVTYMYDNEIGYHDNSVRKLESVVKQPLTTAVEV